MKARALSITRCEAARHQLRRIASALGITLLLASEAGAQAFVPLEGDGSWTLAYQNTSIHEHIDYLGNRLERGNTQTHVLFLRLDYGLTDKLAVSVGVPFIRSKYIGNFPHHHAGFPDHHDEPEIDDGLYHGGLQDYNLVLRYQVWTAPLLVTPFISYSYPSRDYAFRGHSSIGQRLQKLEIGADVAKQFEPPFDRFYFQAGYGYTINEETSDISIRSSKLDLELGYYVNPRLSARVLGIWLKTHNGLDFPVDFPPAPSPLLFGHDRLLDTDIVNLGLGLSFEMSEDYTLFGTWLKTVEGRNAHAIHNSFSVGVNRRF